ncbi:hypothetical protein TNCV_166201 [Trichonephila clavipes]|nr:hypothetical protein TNCV_166201 [Trichonephila clavipes]
MFLIDERSGEHASQSHSLIPYALRYIRDAAYRAGSRLPKGYGATPVFNLWFRVLSSRISMLRCQEEP